jgi:Flp pilus assembly protein TadD
MVPTRRRLEYASGYMALGMHKDAADELGMIEGEATASTEVLRLWATLHHQTEQWKPLVKVAEALAGAEPDEEQGWISWAFALRELDRVKEAEEVLLKAEVLHGKSSAVLHYNLACYACLLGDSVDAKRRLATAVAMDAEFKISALEDPDLEAMRDDLGING